MRGTVQPVYIQFDTQTNKQTINRTRTSSLRLACLFTALNQFKDEAEHKITSTIAAQRSRLEDLEKENADLRSSLSMKTSQLESVTESQSSLQESNDSKDKVIMSLKTQISGENKRTF